MRMLKKAAIATVTAASLSVLGAGTAHADPADVVANLTQTQTCTYQALVPINIAALNKGTAVGSFACTQVGSIG